MALPALDAVQRALPGAAIEVVARPSVVPLFSLVPALAGVIELPPHGGARHEAIAALRGRSFDAAILLANSFQTALAAWRAGIPERWGYRADWRVMLLTRGVARPAGVHQAEYYQYLVRALGFPTSSRPPHLEVPSALQRAGRDVLAARGWDGQAPLVALAPGAAYGGAKRWPAASFASLAERLASDGHAVVMVGSVADAAVGAEVVKALGGAAPLIDLIGGTDLPTLGGVLANCAVLVTNDSGAMHFAAALGVRIVAMFGPTNDRATRPLAASAPEILTHEVWCRPCMLRECPLTHRCMRGIGVEEVLAAAMRSL